MVERKIMYVYLGAVGIAFLIAAAFFFTWGSGSVNASVDDERLHVDAPLVDENISYGNIVSIEIRDDMEFGTRYNGFGGSKILSGGFKNSEFDKYTLACYKNVKKFIVVEHTEGKILVFNQDSVEKTLLLYDELFEKWDNI